MAGTIGKRVEGRSVYFILEKTIRSISRINREEVIMMFLHEQVLEMGAIYFSPIYRGPVHCVACNVGEVAFTPVGNPVFGMVQVYTLRCDHCGRTGKHPN